MGELLIYYKYLKMREEMYEKENCNYNYKPMSSNGYSGSCSYKAITTK